MLFTICNIVNPQPLGLMYPPPPSFASRNIYPVSRYTFSNVSSGGALCGTRAGQSLNPVAFSAEPSVYEQFYRKSLSSMNSFIVHISGIPIALGDPEL